jgi:hypothetical protein
MEPREETKRVKNRRGKLLFPEKEFLGDVSTAVRVSFNPELGSEIHLYIAYHALLLLQHRDF